MSGQSNPKTGLPPHRRMRHDRHFVDELAQRMGEGIGRMVRITAITANQDQPRSSLGALDDLKSSIDSHGVLEPLLVRQIENGRYELVSGERRFHAAMAVGLFLGLALGRPYRFSVDMIIAEVVVGFACGTRRDFPVCDMTLSRKHPRKLVRCPRCHRPRPPSAKYYSACGCRQEINIW